MRKLQISFCSNELTTFCVRVCVCAHEREYANSVCKLHEMCQHCVLNTIRDGFSFCLHIHSAYHSIAIPSHINNESFFLVICICHRFASILDHFLYIHIDTVKSDDFIQIAWTVALHVSLVALHTASHYKKTRAHINVTILKSQQSVTSTRNSFVLWGLSSIKHVFFLCSLRFYCAFVHA